VINMNSPNLSRVVLAQVVQEYNRIDATTEGNDNIFVA